MFLAKHFIYYPVVSYVERAIQQWRRGFRKYRRRYNSGIEASDSTKISNNIETESTEIEGLLKVVIIREQHQQQLQRLTKSREIGQNQFNSGVANSIGEFQYTPDEGTTFTAYYKRYEKVIKEEYKG